jgi:hypothetical protein
MSAAGGWSARFDRREDDACVEAGAGRARVDAVRPEQRGPGRDDMVPILAGNWLLAGRWPVTCLAPGFPQKLRKAAPAAWFRLAAGAALLRLRDTVWIGD